MSAADAPPGRPLVFFTGGTALRELARELAHHPCLTAHIVTTFDSGGSTARLRRAFAMPAVGDLRNRLATLADVDACGTAIVNCMETRLPDEGDPDELRGLLAAMDSPGHPVWKDVDAWSAHSLRSCLQAFLQAMPRDFDARHASLGNVCMAGKYLIEHRQLGAVLPLFGRLLHVRGRVLPIVEESLHLAARLEDGSLLVGQHLFKNLNSPVREIFLTVHEPGRGAVHPEPCRPRAAASALACLLEAGLVCYPMGSFYSSVVANLLTDGVGHHVRGLNCPKVFIPNTGLDRELTGCPMECQLRVLADTLARDCRKGGREGFVSHLVVDRRHGRYAADWDAVAQLARELGADILDVPVVRPDGLSHDPAATADLLLHLAGPAASAPAPGPAHSRLLPHPAAAGDDA